jgi:hypothetical protein
MQGILHTGVTAIRDRMRLAGVFNPIDDGMEVDPGTNCSLTHRHSQSNITNNHTLHYSCQWQHIVLKKLFLNYTVEW